jgi:hypothetical protein
MIYNLQPEAALADAGCRLRLARELILAAAHLHQPDVGAAMTLSKYAV